MSGHVVPALQFAVNRVGVLTAAARSVQAVVTRVTGPHAAFGRQITEQTREEHGHQAHAREARAALRVREGTGPIRTRVARVVVLVRTVVERSLHQTHARSVFHQVVGRTQKLSVASEPRGERPGSRAFRTFTFPTILADVQVGGVRFPHLRLFKGNVRRQKGMGGGFQGFGLSPHGSLRPVPEEAPLRGDAAVAPGTCGAARADGSAESGRRRRRVRPVTLVIIIEAHRDHLVSPLPFVGAPRRHAGARGRSSLYAGTLGVLVTRADGSDLIQGQNGPGRVVRVSDAPSRLTVTIHKTRSEPPHDSTTFI